MPKLVIELCADFETTTSELKEEYIGTYEPIKPSFFKKPPEIYWWGVCIDIKHKKYIPESNYWRIIEREDVIFVWGITDLSFVSFINKFKADTHIIFHNLGKFDGHFLIPALDKFRFNRPKNNISEENMYEEEERLKRVYNSKPWLWKWKFNLENTQLFKHLKYNWNKLLPGEYRELANENAKIISIKIKGTQFKKKKQNGESIKTARSIEVRDNLAMFNGSIKEFGKQLYEDAIKNGMDEKEASEMFFKKDKLDNYKTYNKFKTLDEYEKYDNGLDLKYSLQDTYILYKFRKKMEEYLPKKYWHLTSASTSYHEFLRVFGGKYFDEYLSKGYLIPIQLEKGAIKYKWNKDNPLNAESKFPLFDFEIKEFLAKSIIPVKWLDRNSKWNEFLTINEELNNLFYTGGQSWVNEMYRGVFKKFIKVFDINSAYPSVLNSDSLFPYGVGIKGDKPGYDYKLYKLEILKPIENKKGLPFIIDFNNMENRVYLKKLKRGVVSYIDSHILERFLKYYTNDKTKFKLTTMYSFQAVKGKTIFGQYIDKWYSLKKSSKKQGNKFLESFAKLFLNSLYGKFGSKKIRDSKVWNQYLGNWESLHEIDSSKFYLPWAITTTNLTRMKLVDAVGFNNDNVIGGDTDSIFWTGDETKFNGNLSEELGDWECENPDFYYEGIMRRPKQYLFRNEETVKQKHPKAIKSAFAGINMWREDITIKKDDEFAEIPSYKITLKHEDMIFGKTIGNQLNPVRVYGYGIIITDENEKKIKPVWDFKPIEGQYRITEEQYLEDNKEYLQSINRYDIK